MRLLSAGKASKQGYYFPARFPCKHAPHQQDYQAFQQNFYVLLILARCIHAPRPFQQDSWNSVTAHSLAAPHSLSRNTLSLHSTQPRSTGLLITQHTVPSQHTASQHRTPYHATHCPFTAHSLAAPHSLSRNTLSLHSTQPRRTALLITQQTVPSQHTASQHRTPTHCPFTAHGRTPYLTAHSLAAPHSLSRNTVPSQHTASQHRTTYHATHCPFRAHSRLVHLIGKHPCRLREG